VDTLAREAMKDAAKCDKHCELQISANQSNSERTMPQRGLPLWPRSTSIPRELKYVANPRGPPVYGRDANVPLLEVDAPADLLERLRYSIAPRGPSLATVETQSPDFTFSSGPSMSPEKVSTELAI